MPERTQLLSLVPIDIGFDLRNTGHSIRLYDGFDYWYLDQNNKKTFTSSMAGMEALAECLAHAGYCVVPFMTPYGDVEVVPSGIREEEGKIVWNIRPQNGDKQKWCQGETLQEALTESGWDRVDLHSLSSEEYA